MSDFVIRNLEEPDIPSIVDIQIRAWQTTYKGIIDDAYLNTMNREKIIEKRKKDFKKNSYIVAELNKEVVGFCWYIDDNSFTINASSIDCEIIAL
jgi:heme oxygenase